MKKAVLDIVGMHCTACAMTIDGDLEDFVVGVKSSNTNYAKQQTEVEYDEQKCAIEAIIHQIEKTGYQVKVRS